MTIPEEILVDDPELDALLDLDEGELLALQKADPGLYGQVKDALEYRDLEIEREMCEGSLLEFVRRAWREIDPAELSISWHHEVICEHLELVTYGEIRNLIINIPPRHTKTLIVNVLWPAWIWARGERLPLSGPHVKFLSVSYGAILSEEIALKMRRLVLGEWYQKRWGHRVKILDDQKSRANFANAAGGERLSNSIEGGILGRGGDIKIIDDPQTRKGADSDAERAESLRGMSDLTTRVTDPRIAAQVLIMQRLNVHDATDWALTNWPKDTVHLMFPARFEPDRACYVDPRGTAGELLWPDVWSSEELAQIERGLSALDGEILSDYAVSGQLQQNPIPKGGGIVNKDDWSIWPEFAPRVEDLKLLTDGTLYLPLPEVSHVLLSIDTALSEKETADWSACIVFGVWHRPKLITTIGVDDPLDDGEQPRVVMMGGWRRRCKLNDEALERDGMPRGLVQRVLATARRFGADRIIIENKTRGIDVKNEIERQLSAQPFQIELFEPKHHGDKVARLNSVQPLFGQRLVYAPAYCRVETDGAGNDFVAVNEYEWVRQIMAEVEAVPKGAHDDFADCVSQGLIVLRRDGFLELTNEFIHQQMARRLFRRKAVSVRDNYGV